MLPILFVLVLAVLAWITLRPVWLPQPPENRVTTTFSKSASKAAAATKTATDAAGTTTGNWLNRLKSPFQKRAEPGAQLKAWASEVELAKQAALYKSLPEDVTGLIAWLAGLSSESASRLAGELTPFCHSQNLNLAWLFDPKADAELKTDLEEIVMLYSLAVWKGHRLQPLAAFQAWQAAPYQKENRAFTQQLYTRLVADGLASAPGELLLASDKAREAHAIQAIQAAAVENRAAVLKRVVELKGAGKPDEAPSRPAAAPSEIDQAAVA